MPTWILTKRTLINQSGVINVVKASAGNIRWTYIYRRPTWMLDSTADFPTVPRKSSLLLRAQIGMLTRGRNMESTTVNL